MVQSDSGQARPRVRPVGTATARYRLVCATSFAKMAADGSSIASVFQ